MNKANQLRCDVCQRPAKTLGRYGGCGDWLVCFRCFEKADRIALAQDRWPRVEDFVQLKLMNE